MSTTVNVNYHVKKDFVQSFLFDGDGVIGNLVSPELAPTQVEAEDLRGGGSEMPSFASDGLVFLHRPSQVSPDPKTHAWEARYETELERILTDQLGAQEVIVFDHTVRVDDPDSARKPARNVHNDYSEAGAHARLIDLVGEDRAGEFHRDGFGFVNVWRPVENPIQSSPLGFIRPDTISAADWVDIQLVYPNRIGQILGVVANPKHHWFFLSEMTPDEVAIFNIYDNTGRPQLAHSALDLPADAKSPFPRKSVESRTLVRYG
ncbi:MAG: CmcJ/NvfI family oxidoreductase [Pseudomonadota bacterium]